MTYGVDEPWPAGFGPGDGSTYDPSQGTRVVTPDGRVMNFAAGEQPYIGSPGGGDIFASADPDEIARYQHNRRTRNLQGIAKVATVVGGGAALAGTPWSLGGTGQGALTSVGSDAFGAMEPGTGALSEIAPQTGGLLPGGATGLPYSTEMMAFPELPGALTQAANPGFFAKMGQGLKGLVTNPDGSINWANALKFGGGALGALGSLTGHSSGSGGGGGAPPLPPNWNAPLRPKAPNRQFVDMPESDYYTYGKSGGEHQFFQPAGATAAAPMSAPRDKTSQIDMYRGDPMQARADGGGVRGPGTGRSDEIEALLSDGEYVMDAETVSMLGDGSVDAGAKRLDEMRANLRKHKGKALAKGKFSPNAKQPEKYLRKARGGVVRKAKGGKIDVPIGGVRVLEGMKGKKPPRDVRAAELAAVQRMLEALKTQPIKKAKGGAVKDLERFATMLEGSISDGNQPRMAQIRRQMESINPGSFEHFHSGLAKGGKVTSVLKSFFDTMTQPEDMKRFKAPQQLTPQDAAYLIAWLRQNDPNNPTLRQHDIQSDAPPVINQRSPEDVLQMLQKVQ